MSSPAQDLEDPGIPVIWVCCRPLSETNKSWAPKFGDVVEVTKK